MLNPAQAEPSMQTNSVIATINQEQLLTDRPSFRVGDTIAVVIRVIEGDKTRPQTYQGVVIAINNRGVHTSFIVRKLSHGIGVERTFMLHSRAIQNIRVVRTGDVRQARIYYMRSRSGKAARIAERFDSKPSDTTSAPKASKKNASATADIANQSEQNTSATATKVEATSTAEAPETTTEAKENTQQETQA